ncbi:hypothetical protein QSI_1382 [Clostridioides difficile P28]|nr:hypothetical protein QSI_1382 [Clostridioides difficile P28]
MLCNYILSKLSYPIYLSYRIISTPYASYIHKKHFLASLL